jgi:hypothetical protein
MQHATLTLERWAAFPRDEQLLMIANEMNRASKLLAPQDESRLTKAYERTLQLTDLTVAARPARGLTRELLRWRDLIAQLYVSPARERDRHRQALRALLQLVPATARQIPYLLPDQG